MDSNNRFSKLSPTDNNDGNYDGNYDKNNNNNNIVEFIKINEPVGKILNFDDINGKSNYFIYILGIFDENHKIIILCNNKNSKNEIFKDFFRKMLNKFTESEKYTTHYQNKDEYYSEIFALLFSDYFKLISEDNELVNEIIITPQKIDVEHYGDMRSEDNLKYNNLIKKHTTELSEYVGNYLKYGLRLSDEPDINKKKFINNV
jgi:hypothetical protein